MSSQLSVPLTDELQEFVDAQVGDGSLYTTADEYVRALLREKKERLEATSIRSAILAGYGDVLNGRSAEFTGNLRSVIEKLGG